MSDETKINLSLAATGRVLTKEVRLKISQARKGIKLSHQTRVKISEAAKSIRGITVLVKNIKTSEVCEFASLTDAASTLGVSRTAIRKYLVPSPPPSSSELGGGGGGDQRNWPIPEGTPRRTQVNFYVGNI